MTNAATTCYNQIKTMDKMAMWDWGVLRTRPTASSDGNTLTLKSSGMVKWKGYIAITYNTGSDLYDIEFFRIRKPRRTKANPFTIPEKKVDKTLDGVFFDMLINVIDGQVLGR